MVSKKCEGRDCNNVITNDIAILESKENWGKVLCMDCQVKANELAHGSKTVEETHNPLDCEDIPEEHTFEDIHGPIDEEKAVDIPERNMPTMVQNYVNSVQQMDEDLTQENVRKYICETATDQEIFSFLKLCEYRKLNPFIKEAYLVKYGTSPATLIVGKDAFTKKAEENPMFDGFEAGIVTLGTIADDNDGKIPQRKPGTLKADHEKIIGGWAKVYRKDRKVPFFAEVSMSEYNTGKSSWAKIPATMIRKVALVQALREAFPSELGGCYDSAEMDQARRD